MVCMYNLVPLYLVLAIKSGFGSKNHRQCSYERSKSWTNIEEEQKAS